MVSVVHTTRFTRGRLPHWEIERGRYFVTVRCADSLPAEAVKRLREIDATLQQIEPASAQFAVLQRRYFASLDKFLDAGHGSSPLRDPRAANVLVATFENLKPNGGWIPHYAIMPNHFHALVAPADGAPLDLHQTMTRLKGRSSRAINLALGRSGALWQHEWFDRWMRDDAEWERCVAYIRNNPVKAGLAPIWTEYPWTR